MYKYMQVDWEVDNINGIGENHSFIQAPEEQELDCLCWKIVLLRIA